MLLAARGSSLSHLPQHPIHGALAAKEPEPNELERQLVACLGSTAPLPPERPFRASLSGSLLEFLQPRSHDRGASVSSSFPSHLTLGGSPLLRQSPL